jgi:hypothetical protein
MGLLLEAKLLLCDPCGPIWEADTLQTSDAQWPETTFCQQPPYSEGLVDWSWWSARPDCTRNLPGSPKVWISADSADPNHLMAGERNRDIYSANIQPYESVLVVFLTVTLVNESPKNFHHFASFSRDGFHIQKATDRDVGTFSPSSPDETKVRMPKVFGELLFVNCPVRFVGDEMRFLLSVIDFTRFQGRSKKTPFYGRVLNEWSLRRDGFASISPIQRGGYEHAGEHSESKRRTSVLVTRPLVFSHGTLLFVNVALPESVLCVEVYDPNIANISGLTAHGCADDRDDQRRQGWLTLEVQYLFSNAESCSFLDLLAGYLL